MAFPPSSPAPASGKPGRKGQRRRRSVISQLGGLMPRTTRGRAGALGSLAAMALASTLIAQASFGSTSVTEPASALSRESSQSSNYTPKVTLAKAELSERSTSTRIDYSTLSGLSTKVDGLGKEATARARDAARDIATLKATADAAVEEAAPPKQVNDPAGAKSFASTQLSKFGWGQDQMSCLVTLWNRESNWSTTAENSSSGAYGIVQSLPGSKMSSVANDWKTNYKTQVTWGLGYVKDRYGSPCGALAFHYANNWY